MSEKVLARRYLNAYVNCYSNDKKIEAVQKLQSTLQIILKNKRLFKALQNPTLSINKKMEFVLQFVRKEDVLLCNFLNVIVSRSRSVLFSVLMSESYFVLSSLNNNIVAKAFSSTKLKDQEEASITQFLKSYFKKDIELNVFVDESIMAGVRIEASNIIFDATLDNALNKLKLAFK